MCVCVAEGGCSATINVTINVSAERRRILSANRCEVARAAYQIGQGVFTIDHKCADTEEFFVKMSMLMAGTNRAVKMRQLRCCSATRATKHCESG